MKIRSDSREAERAPAAERRTGLAEWLPYAGYLAAAVLLFGRLWRDPTGRTLRDNFQDHVFFEWVVTHAANALIRLDDPLFTDQLNAPYGVNLMANTSMLAVAMPMAPVTLLGGPGVTFALLSTVALAGTAAAWYFVLRRLLMSRVAAALGGAFCGFAPAMISQATGHPNIAGQYLLPFIVLTVLRLREPGSPVRRGLVLAGLVVLQAFLNEELLFFTALSLGVFVAAYAVSRPREIAARAPEALRTLGVTALASAAALAYPLYRQFFGAQAYRGLPEFVLGYGADLASYPSYARRSLVGDADVSGRLAQGPTEENTFFGWPLLLVLIAVVAWLIADAVVRALAVTGATFAVLSFGREIAVNGKPSGVPGPWTLFDGLPLFDSVVPTRLALVVTPVVGCLLAMFVDRLRAPGVGRRLRMVLIGSLVAVLLPLAPTPLPVNGRQAVPRFFAMGGYREHIPRDGVVFTVPPGWYPGLHAMRWQTATGQRFAIFGGYFLAPDPNRADRRAIFGPAYPPTALLLGHVADTGQPVQANPTMREQARKDLEFIGATTIVLPANHARAEALRASVDQLVGPGRLVSDVWLWDLRP